MHECLRARTIQDMYECAELFNLLKRMLLTLKNPEKRSNQEIQDALFEAEFPRQLLVYKRPSFPDDKPIDPKFHARSIKTSYKQELNDLLRDELIERCKALREEISQEFEELRLVREYWNHPGNQANYDYWGHLDYWSADEGIALSLGLDPRHISISEMRFESEEFSIPSQYVLRYDILSSSIEAGELSQPVIPTEEFLKWLEWKGFTCPDELKLAVEKHKGITPTAPSDLNEAETQGLKFTREAKTPETLLKHRLWVDLWLLCEKENPGSGDRDLAHCVWKKLISPENVKEGTIRKAVSEFKKANPDYLS